MESSAPRLTRSHALSLTTIASKLAPTGAVVFAVLSYRDLSEANGCAINALVAPTYLFGSAYDL
jgi:hypothetical protein